MNLTTCAAWLLAWLPDSAREPRETVCAAILTATNDALERGLLLATAVEESGLRADVLDCRTRGDQGRARGAWQVHARSRQEARALCVVASAADIALTRLRESQAACAHLPPPRQLAGYASGRCASRAGQRISLRRWQMAIASLEVGS